MPGLFAIVSAFGVAGTVWSLVFGDGLSGTARYFYDALLAFTCWLINGFFDLAFWAIIEGLRIAPGGWMTAADAENMVFRAGQLDAYGIPLITMLTQLGIFVEFLLVWVVVRTCMRILPWSA